MFTLEEIVESYLECRKNKRNSLSALAFEVDLEHNLAELHREILCGTYTISPSIVFVVTKPVRREVFAASFRDRVVHHLVMRRLIPHLEREFITESYACRPGKGTLFGVERIQRFIARCSQGYTRDCYIFKGDIAGFFMHIDRRLLCEKLEAFIDRCDFGDRKPVAGADLFSASVFRSETAEQLKPLVRQIVMNDPMLRCHVNGSRKRWDRLPADKSMFGINGRPMPNGFLSRPKTGEGSGNGNAGGDSNGGDPGKGLPIGNLTSQWFGNFYLHELDLYVRQTLGVRYYGRYVDDFILIDEDKELLKAAVAKIETFLREHLLLRLHPRKYYLQHYTKGIGFLGAYLKRGAMMTGTRAKTHAYQVIHRWNREAEIHRLSYDDLKQLRASINSYWGLMVHHDSYRLRKAMARKFSPRISRRITYAGYGKIKIKEEPARYKPEQHSGS